MLYVFTCVGGEHHLRSYCWGAGGFFNVEVNGKQVGMNSPMAFLNLVFQWENLLQPCTLSSAPRASA